MIYKNAYKFCREPLENVENYDKAIADKNETWQCHHRDEIRTLPSGITVVRKRSELIENGRYYNCPANELIFLTKSDHMKLHWSGNCNPMFGRTGETCPSFGRTGTKHYNWKGDNATEKHKKHREGKRLRRLRRKAIKDAERIQALSKTEGVLQQ